MTSPTPIATEPSTGSSRRLPTAPDGATPRLAGAGIPWRVLAITGTGAFMVSLDLSIVNVAFPALARSFSGTPTATLSWVLSAYSVFFGALLLGAGRLADRSGRRRWFVRGLAVFTLGSALCAAAPTAGWLICGRVVQATGAALLIPASLVCCSRPARRRSGPRRCPCSAVCPRWPSPPVPHSGHC